MKIFVITIACLAVCFLSYAQTENRFENSELHKQLNLTQEQVNKIKELNKGLDKRHEEIGKDRSVSGREKGQKRQELALKHKQDIMDILTPEQRIIWENKYDKKGQGIKNSLADTYDDRLKVLEKEYQNELKAINQNKTIGKREKKEMKNNLKSKYKADKERLKNEKDNAKHSVLIW